MAAEEDELLDAEERAEEAARLEAEALAAEAKAAGEELKKLMKDANRQDEAKLQVLRASNTRFRVYCASAAPEFLGSRVLTRCATWLGLYL